MTISRHSITLIEDITHTHFAPNVQYIIKKTTLTAELKSWASNSGTETWGGWESQLAKLYPISHWGDVEKDTHGHRQL